MAAKRRTPKTDDTTNPADEPKRDRINRTECTRTCKCDLSEAEIRERGDRAARLVGSIAQREEALKAESKTRKAQIAEEQAELVRISSEVATRATYREVPVQVLTDYEKGTVTEMRLDTFDVISTRPITDYERQGEFGFAT